MIKYVKGDLFEVVTKSTDSILVPHVVNNIGAWGAGFVIPLMKHYPRARDRYLKWSTETDFLLGNTQFVQVSTNVVIANMLAQDGITSRSTGARSRVSDRPLRYDSLVDCMNAVGDYCHEVAKLTDTCLPTIHCPQFGAGLAGGNWEFIDYLIQDCWNRRGIDTVVYQYGD